ncbi:MAG TPA: hypothetical protein VHZ04_01185 [Candidatus Paceibacterota bacterium]|jgi:hypothetical protein|nr:hypothetical protein [Candidatus Paceibacterota bacterium]
MELAITNAIPDSVLPYPNAILDRVKFHFWKGIAPTFLFTRDALIASRVIRHEGRQEYFLGKLAEGKSIDDFLQYLEVQGFANHFIALKDDGQLLSLRRLENFERQYHLRIFRDGEVRGHYEYTPEAHPVWHWKETRMEPRQEVFLNILGDWISAS